MPIISTIRVSAFGGRSSAAILAALLLSLAAPLYAQTPQPGPPTQLRVMTWNIHHAEGVDGKLDMQRIADVIKAQKPDLVALQEVDHRTERTRKMDQPAQLAQLTGMHASFGKAIDYQGGEYGQVILSRWLIPSQSLEVVKLPGDPTKEQRIALVARLKPGESAPVIRFVSTHLDHTRDSTDRPGQASHLQQHLGSGEEPTILAGDLNDVPDGEVMRRLGRDWMDAARDAGPTIPAAQPTRRIDYILVRPAARWRVLEAKVLDEPVASDHRPVVVTLELR